jgi:hypothetical protein
MHNSFKFFSTHIYMQMAIVYLIHNKIFIVFNRVPNSLKHFQNEAIYQLAFNLHFLTKNGLESISKQINVPPTGKPGDGTGGGGGGGSAVDCGCHISSWFSCAVNIECVALKCDLPQNPGGCGFLWAFDCTGMCKI